MTIRQIVLGAALAGLAVSPSFAQDAVPRVALHQDWSVFNTADPQECFVASAPTATAATRGGQAVQVRRGEIRFYISTRPAENVRNEVAFTGGYPYRDGSTVNIDIGGSAFELFTEGEWAWPATPEDDRNLLSAMRRGAKAVVTGVSSRGTTTVDTFSLIGFSAAVDDANQRCAGDG